MSFDKHAYYIANREHIKAKSKAYYLSHRDEIMAQGAILRKDPEHKRKQRVWHYAWRKRNVLQSRMRTRIRIALLRAEQKNKRDRTINYLGCSWSDFKAHLVSLFTEGMSWDMVEYGEIQVDHIRQICTFDLSSETERRAAFHYTNTRPLWKKDNLSRPKREVPHLR